MVLSLEQNSQDSNVHKLIVADISPTISPSHASIHSYLEKMVSIDMSSLDSSSIFAARKQVDTILCELEALNNVIHLITAVKV